MKRYSRNQGHLIVLLVSLLTMMMHVTRGEDPPVTINVAGGVLLAPPDEKQWTWTQFIVDLYQTQQFLQVLTVCATNSFLIPAIYMAYKRCMYPECVGVFMLFVTSTFYHIGETLGVKILGMNHGQWHRLDNIFVICSLQNLLFFLCFSTCVSHIRQNTQDESAANMMRYIASDEKFISLQKSWLEFMRWASNAMVIFCQEKGPWNELYTILPILLVLIYCFYHLYRTPYRYKPRYNVKRLSYGLVFMIIGVVFFIRGLDDINDYLKINHGLWHSFAAIGSMFLFDGKQTSKRVIKLLAQREARIVSLDEQYANNSKAANDASTPIAKSHSSSVASSTVHSRVREIHPLTSEYDV